MRLRVLVARITIETGSVESVCIICCMDRMSLRELTDVLTALLFYDFLLSFMLTGCDGCIESDSKSLSHYPASRVSFDLPRKIGKRKETLLAACTFHIEHAPNSNVTEPRAASLSK